MTDGRPATARESLIIWIGFIIASIPGATAYAAIAWYAGWLS
jgi:hypothetical protein